MPKIVLASGLRRDLLGLAMLACLAGAGAIEGLLLANGPVLRDYVAVRLGPQGIFVSLPWLCVVAFAALGAAAGLASWLRTLFLSLLAVPVSWSLAKSSQHPWWLLKKSAAWHPQAPTALTLLGHAVAVALVCCALLIEALGRYRDAATAQEMPPAQARADEARLMRRGAAVAFACLVLAFLLPGILDPLAVSLQGAVRGPAAFAVLLGSTALLLVGLGLLATPGRTRRRRRRDEADAPEPPVGALPAPTAALRRA